MEPQVPKGEVLKFSFDNSKIFPGTVRDYWVYIPAQYAPPMEACVYVNQDGIQFNAPDVFDRLIASKDMPVTIGVFVSPGRVPAVRENTLDRFNRSFEYDTLSPAYARFLLEELLPEVEAQTASDGRPINLSTRSEDRAIGGASSGAICAFTVAWERPDAFRRVFSAIGTYVGIHGGNAYPTLVRKTEPKPLRIFLQDGSNDLNINRGDWWMANQELERALVFMGYEVEHRWGEGGHDGKQATELFPDAMKWLWKGWPDSPVLGKGSPQTQALFDPGSTWERVGDENGQSVAGLACDRDGSVVYADNVSSRIMRISSDGQADASFRQSASGFGALAFGPDGTLYLTRQDVPLGLFSQLPGTDEPVEVSTDWPRDQNFALSAVVVDHQGTVFVTDYGDPLNRKIRVIERGKKVLDEKISAIEPTGLALSPDRSLLYVADSASHWVWSFQIQTDGTLSKGQKFFHLHVADTEDDADAQGLAIDSEGRLYVGTNLGIQVCDPAGRVDSIIPGPNGPVSSLIFGGKDRSTLYAVSGGTLYRRAVKVRGLESFETPLKPTAPRL